MPNIMRNMVRALWVLRLRHREQVAQAARVPPELRKHAVDRVAHRELVKMVLVHIQPLHNARLVVCHHQRRHNAGGGDSGVHAFCERGCAGAGWWGDERRAAAAAAAVASEHGAQQVHDGRAHHGAGHCAVSQDCCQRLQGQQST
jgi:hypothetical protein